MENVKRVANTLISEANKHNDKIDNQRLQRFLYYVEGFCLGLFDESAFQEKITMSKVGPVVKSVYDELIPHGTETINDAFLGSGRKVESEKLAELIQEVYRSYRRFSTSKLNAMIIFIDGTPHHDDLALRTPLKSVTYYSPQKMRNYFVALLNNSDEKDEVKN